MSFTYEGAYQMPGQTAEVNTFTNQFWWDKREAQTWTQMVIAGASRDTGNTGYTTLLRSGLILGRVTTTKKIKEWNPTGTDGSEKIFGILDIDVNTQRLGSNQDRWLGYLMVAGRIKADRLIIPGNASLGIVGDSLEHLIRAQLFGRFIFDDDYSGNYFGGYRNVVAKTADYTVVEGDNNTLFTTRGAAGAVNFTLPATPKKGLRFAFYNAANQNLTVTAGTADTLVAINDLAADSISLETADLKIGGMIEIFGDGTGWLSRVSAGQTSDGTTSGQLVTVAT